MDALNTLRHLPVIAPVEGETERDRARVTQKERERQRECKTGRNQNEMYLLCKQILVVMDTSRVVSVPLTRLFP